MKYCILIELLSAVLLNCKSIKTLAPDATKVKVEDTAFIDFWQAYANIPNEDGSYILNFKNNKKIEDLLATVEFYIVNAKTNHIIYKDSHKAGSVKWYSTFEVIAAERNLRKEGSNKLSPPITHIYNVRTPKKISSLQS